MSAAAEPAARFRDLVAAEWLKFWTLRSTRWGVLLSALVVVGINADAAWSDYRNWPTYGPVIRHEFVPGWSLNDAFTAGAVLVLMLAAGTLGVLAIVSDYASGLARTTFAAVPARRSVVLAKAVVLVAVLSGYGLVVSGASFWASQAILSGRHIGLSLGYPGALRAIAASALLAPVCALVGLGLGALVRHTAASVVTAVVTLLMLPFFLTERRRLSAELLHALPRAAWERLTSPDGSLPNPAVPYPAGLGASWLVYAAWAVVAVTVAVVAVHRRDL